MRPFSFAKAKSRIFPSDRLRGFRNILAHQQLVNISFLLFIRVLAIVIIRYGRRSPKVQELLSLHNLIPIQFPIIPFQTSPFRRNIRARPRPQLPIPLKPRLKPKGIFIDQRRSRQAPSEYLVRVEQMIRLIDIAGRVVIRLMETSFGLGKAHCQFYFQFQLLILLQNNVTINIIFNICSHQMGRIFKTGRVVIVTSGRFAGKKAIVAKTYDEGNKKHKFPHLLLVGIARNPRDVKRRINKKKFIKKTGVKTFVKYVNQNHVIPTRFVVNDFDFKDLKDDVLKTAETKKAARKDIRKKFTETYRNLPNPKTNDKAHTVRFFFSRLRF